MQESDSSQNEDAPENYDTPNDIPYETTISTEEEDTGYDGRKKTSCFVFVTAKAKKQLPKPVIKEVVEGTADLLRNSVQRLKR